MTGQDAAQRAEVIERAKQEVFAICKGRHGGGHEWRMSIPVNEERDSDCIIMAGLNAIAAAVAEAVVSERERCAQIAESLRTMMPCPSTARGEREWAADVNHGQEIAAAIRRPPASAPEGPK